jgi:septum formation protein
VVRTTVTFGPITDAALDWYLATGEPFDKAGAYGIQGAGGLFVTRIDGSYHNVVGLPLHALAAAVTELDLGVGLLDWSR